uniref:BRISC and BRCA1-A complex member 1 n=1 Tax=Periophthalmus magnuspinnatus TaxID=409849 RepID=A0A3B4AN56_9GOBI
MDTPEPGPADGEERMVELRPRTRSNPEGAEDRRGSTGSLGGNSNGSIPQPAVGSRVEGEGEASTSDTPPSSTTASVSVTVAQTAPPTAAAAVAGPSTAGPSSNAAAAAVVKERPKLAQSQPPMSASIPPPAEYQLRVPRVNCPEKVIICLDLSEEMSLPKLESFNSKTNALNISQKMIEMFVRTKHKIDKRHEFALVVVNDDALWQLSGFTSDPRELCSCLYDLETNVCESFLEDLLNVRQKIELPMTENVQTIPPPYVIRTVLIYSRQAGPLQFNPSEAVSLQKMLQSPYFFFDVVYLHNGMDEQGDETSWRQENYTSFCNLDSKGMCYRYEVSLCGPAIELHNCMAKLLSHPLQRPFQSHASYSLLEGEEPQDVEATV